MQLESNISNFIFIQWYFPYFYAGLLSCFYYKIFIEIWKREEILKLEL